MLKNNTEFPTPETTRGMSTKRYWNELLMVALNTID